MSKASFVGAASMSCSCWYLLLQQDFQFFETGQQRETFYFENLITNQNTQQEKAQAVSHEGRSTNLYSAVERQPQGSPEVVKFGGARKSYLYYWQCWLSLSRSSSKAQNCHLELKGSVVGVSALLRKHRDRRVYTNFQGTIVFRHWKKVHSEGLKKCILGSPKEHYQSCW